MQDIVYMGKKTLLIDSDDLADMTFKTDKKAMLFKAKMQTLRAEGYKIVVVLTSLKYAAMPKEVRDLVRVQKNCFMGTIE